MINKSNIRNAFTTLTIKLKLSPLTALYLGNIWGPSGPKCQENSNMYTTKSNNPNHVLLGTSDRSKTSGEFIGAFYRNSWRII